MPGFNPDARMRIKRAVRKSEGLDTTGSPGGLTAPSDLMWLKLIEDFGTETEDMAGANPGEWSTSEPDDNGSYIPDVTTIYNVRDPHGNCGAVTGDWVLCQPRGTVNGTVWEVIANPISDLVLWGKLDGNLAYNGTATVSVWEDDWSADTGDNIEDALPPPTMSTGTITSGSWVRIRRRPDGVWYVDMAPC